MLFRYKNEDSGYCYRTDYTPAQKCLRLLTRYQYLGFFEQAYLLALLSLDKREYQVKVVVTISLASWFG
jgi:hypothetical protein